MLLYLIILSSMDVVRVVVLKIEASSSTCPILSLIHSNFTNNTALYGGGLLIYIQCANVTVSNSRFSYNTVQRLGGGVRIFVNNGTRCSNFTFIQSTFEYNIVLGNNTKQGEPPAGGGLYIYSTVMKPTIPLRVTGCIFNNNYGHNYGGGLAINRDNRFKSPIEAVIENSLFQSNSAYTYNGGAIHTSTKINISHCKFTNNTGSCIFYETFLPNITINNSIFSDNHKVGLHSGSDTGNLLVMNTLFERQQGHAMDVAVYYGVTLVNVSIIACKDAAVLIQCSTITPSVHNSRNICLSNLTILNNQGTGLDMTNCFPVFFDGNNTIANNNAALDGGGMAIYGLGGVRLLPNATLSFSNNTAGRYGGGMYIEELNYSHQMISWFLLL